MVKIENYPAIKKHLDIYWKEIIKRSDKGNTPYNLRNCAYMEDFYKQKIVWIELTDNPNFYLDENNFLLNNTIFFINGNRLEYLVAFLNSKVCKWFFTKMAATSGVGTTRWIKIYIEKILVPEFINTEFEISLISYVKEIQCKKALGLETIELENKIDNIIFALFNFTTEEINFMSIQ